MKIEEVLKRLDYLFETNRMDEVEDFLSGKLEEAMEEEDTSSVITIVNEMIGFFRDTGQDEKSIAYSRQILSLMEKLGMEGTVPYATTLLNAANAYRAAGLLEDSLACYKKVYPIYEEQLDKEDFRFASLENNLSLLYQEMEEFEKAVESLEKALAIVKKYPEAQFELAVTYANLGTSLLKLNREQEAKERLQEALRLFEAMKLKDSHYCAALASMGEVLFRQREYEKAAQCYENTLALLEVNTGKTKSYERIKESLSLVYERWGRKNEDKGLALSEQFYLEYGAPMIHEKFPEYEEKIAVGLVGEGSECFGFDDTFSKDHDFGPGFCMWVTKETYEKIGAQLQAEYEKLPKVFKGVERKTTVQGKHRCRVWVIEEFYQYFLGIPRVPDTEQEWLFAEEEMLAEAVNGRVFKDGEGRFSAFRKTLMEYYPDGVWKKKIAQEMALFSQTGQYNYFRMLERKDRLAASIALNRFAEHAMKLAYLLNRKYAPYYKWLSRGMKYFTRLSDVHDMLEELLLLAAEDRQEECRALIERMAGRFLEELKVEGLVEGEDTYLEHYAGQIAQSVQNVSKTKEEYVEEIVKLEWEAFDKVENEGGRASCQNNFGTFSIMRKSQYLAWTEAMLAQYLADFREAMGRGWNPITEKYARMMESTAPDKYRELENSLPPVSEEKRAIMEEIIKIQVGWMEEFAEQYPKMADNARTIHTYEDSEFDTSYETYLRGEMGTYSDDMLMLYGRFVAGLAGEGKNLAKMIMTNTALLYGYDSLEAAEKAL